MLLGGGVIPAARTVAGPQSDEMCYTLRREAIDDQSGRHGLFYWTGTATIMLAVPSAPLRLIGPVDHALALHPGGLGRVTIARRSDGSWREKSVPVDDLAYVVRHLRGEQDVYLTQNRFHGCRRLVSRLAELDALFVDLDFYKTAHAGAHPQHVLDLALGALDQAKVPCPSFAVSSGRGLAMIWLHRPVPRAALPRWRACQEVLCRTLKPLGADRQATDAARVLRLVGTRNSCSNTLVEAILPVGEVWDFDLLADEILPVARAQLIALNLERARRRAAGQGSSTRSRPTRWFTAASLWELRLAELQRLREHRWFGALPPGQRDLWMLLAGVAISYLVPAVMVHREIVALADEITGGQWHERETRARMSSVIARAEQAARGEKVEYCGKLVDPRYRFRTTSVVELLDITEAEMRACGLRNLVSPDRRRELERQRWHDRRAAAGGIARADYLKHALTRQRPWKAEGVSRAAWYRRRETSPSRCMVAKPLVYDPPPDAPVEIQETAA